MSDIKWTDSMNNDAIEALINAPSGEQTKIAEASEDLIRIQLRGEGFLRKILPPETVTNDQMDRSEKHEYPVKIIDIEPGNKGAVSVPFNTAREAEYFHGSRAAISFYQVKTRRYQKNLIELSTYRSDIRKLLTENVKRDITLEEDTSFINAVDEIVGAYNGVGDSGFQQHFKAGDGTDGTIPALLGGIDRSTYPEIKKFLERRRLNNGVFLMNRSTAKEFEKWDRVEIGGDLSESMYKDGLKAQGDTTIFGVPHIFTMEDQLVPDNIIYGFTEPSFLGKFYVMQEPTMYVTKDEDIISFGLTETIGLGLVNVAGMVKIDFNELGS